MSASGLPGSLVEAMRAGMTMRMSAIAPPRPGARHRPASSRAKMRRGFGVIRVASVEANRLFVHRRNPAAAAFLILPCEPWAMDSFELNKILGAILGTCLAVLSINIAAGAIFAPVKPAKPGYDIVVPEKQPGGAAKPAEPEVPIEQLLAKASIEKGANSAKKCSACHNFTKGGPNLVGPDLWGIVGRPKGSVSGFNYSAAMKAKGGTWTID